MVSRIKAESLKELGFRLHLGPSDPQPERIFFFLLSDLRSGEECEEAEGLVRKTEITSTGNDEGMDSSLLSVVPIPATSVSPGHLLMLFSP